MSTFNLLPSEPYLNCNIWEIQQYPKSGKNYDFHLLHDIYYHNSLIINEQKQQSAYIMIPEFLIGNLEHKDILIKNKNEIISKKIPVIRKINDETWVIDLSFFETRE
jgi:hypothetical protein